MNSRQLEVFRAIMHYGTLTRAAQELNVSQSALSQILLRMEDQVGPLFHRDKGRLVPTVLAEQLYPEVERVYTELEGLRNLTQEIKLGRMPPVRISASAPLLMSFLPPLKRCIKESGLGLDVISYVYSIDLIFNTLIDGQAEIGLTMIPSSSKELRTEIIGETEMVCLLPVGHRLAEQEFVTANDLKDEPLISYRRDNEFGILLAKRFAELGCTYKPDIEIDVSMSSVIFVQQALGVAVMEGASPWSAFAGVTQRPFRPRVPLPICLISNVHRAATKSQIFVERALRDLARQGAAQS